MHKPKIFKDVINHIAKVYGNHPGKMLVHTGVIGWALSSLAQVCAIIINDKIPKEQKMFLVPQEIADAGVNIISFYLITQTVKGVALKMVNMGKLLPKSVRNFLAENNVKNVGSKTFDVLKDGKLTDDVATKFNDFRNGVDVVATTIGSIISCNLVTPVVRNGIAANRQKELMARQQKRFNAPADVKNPDYKPSYMMRPSIVDFKATAYNSMLNSKGSMTI